MPGYLVQSLNSSFPSLYIVFQQKFRRQKKERKKIVLQEHQTTMPDSGIVLTTLITLHLEIKQGKAGCKDIVCKTIAMFYYIKLYYSYSQSYFYDYFAECEIEV